MKVVVISGGSSGIGEAIVKKFSLSNSYYIYNLDIVENNSLNNINNYQFIKTDVSNESQIIKSVNHIIDAHKTIDILIPNAGKHLSANIEDTSTEQLDEILNLNLLSSFWLIKYFIPYMKAKGGVIINIGSDQSSIAKKNSAAYGMSKAALLHLTKSTAIDYAQFNIRANCIGAGTVDTPLYQNAIMSYSQKNNIDIEKIKNDEEKQQPLGRIGLSTEIAEVVYFLSQDEASYITGALIPVDGGYIAR